MPSMASIVQTLEKPCQLWGYLTLSIVGALLLLTRWSAKGRWLPRYYIPPFDIPRCRWESFAFRKTRVSATVFESVVRIEDSLYVTMTYAYSGDFTHAYACHPALHIHSRMRLRRRLPSRGRAWAGWGWGAICIPPSPQKGLFWPVNHHRLKRFVCVLCSPPTASTVPTID